MKTARAPRTAKPRTISDANLQQVSGGSTPVNKPVAVQTKVFEVQDYSFDVTR